MPDRSTDPETLAIANDLLDRSGRAMMTRDFDLFAGCVTLPHKVSNFDESFVISDHAALQRGFDKVCDALLIQAVTDLVRDCIAAEIVDTETLHFAHISHLMAGAQRVRPPYPCFSVVRRIGGRWYLAATDYALDARSGQARAMKQAATTEAGHLVALAAAETCPWPRDIAR